MQAYVIFLRFLHESKCQNSPIIHISSNNHSHTHPFNGPLSGTTQVSQYTHPRLTALCTGLPRWAGTRKVKPIWILLKQETVSGTGICLAICKSAHRSRQITTPAPHHSSFYRPDALPAAQPTVSKHWRRASSRKVKRICILLTQETVSGSAVALAEPYATLHLAPDR